jgi:hypothetical protein
MRRLVAIALLVGSPASSRAQRAAPIGAMPHSIAVDSAMASRRSMSGHIASSLASSSTATIDDAPQGSAWKWVAVGALTGAVVCGTIMKADALHPAAWKSEFSGPLGFVIGGLSGAVVGGLAYRLLR